MAEVPQRVEPLDSGVAEAWTRLTEEQHVRGVSATRLKNSGEWAWQLEVWAMEFVREQPLETELRAAIESALAAVSGVRAVESEDREVWVVDGDLDGEALVGAVAGAVDGFSDRIRAHIAALTR